MADATVSQGARAPRNSASVQDERPDSAVNNSETLETDPWWVQGARDQLDTAHETLGSLIARMSELEEQEKLEDFLFADVCKVFRCVWIARNNLTSSRSTESEAAE
jgi:hypothetical protein